MKALTREQAQARKRQAVRFVRDVLGDPDRAAEIEDEDLEDYAERRKFRLTNQRRHTTMAGNGDPRSKQELLDEIDDLQSQLNAIYDIVAPADEEEPEDEDGDNGDDDGR